MKTCSMCKLNKPISLFNKSGNKRQFMNAYCKPCQAIYDKRYNLKRRFNITVEDYNTMFLEQGGCCAICKKHQSNFKRSLHIDHDHSTGKVRGLLCFACNSAIGKFEESEEIINNSLEYLREWR